jgi:hypothetical protein
MKFINYSDIRFLIFNNINSDILDASAMHKTTTFLYGYNSVFFRISLKLLALCWFMSELLLEILITPCNIYIYSFNSNFAVIILIYFLW